MARASLLIAIAKLAAAGEQAGFTVEQMIELLDSGLPVETLLELITWRLSGGSNSLSFVNDKPSWYAPSRSARA